MRQEHQPQHGRRPLPLRPRRGQRGYRKITSSKFKRVESRRAAHAAYDQVVLPSPSASCRSCSTYIRPRPDVINACASTCAGATTTEMQCRDGPAARANSATRVNLAVPSRRSYMGDAEVTAGTSARLAIGVPNLREADVQLKKRLAIRKSRSDLPPDHPKYSRSRYGGQPLASGRASASTSASSTSSTARARATAASDEATMFDYMGAKGCRKLLIAHQAGRAQFKKEGRRTKFIFQCRDTMALAEFLMATEDPYGPSTPYVPGSEKYCVAPNITQFTRGPLSGNGCTFVDGPIKTGAAGFDESTRVLLMPHPHGVASPCPCVRVDPACINPFLPYSLDQRPYVTSRASPGPRRPTWLLTASRARTSSTAWWSSSSAACGASASSSGPTSAEHPRGAPEATRGAPAPDPSAATRATRSPAAGRRWGRAWASTGPARTATGAATGVAAARTGDATGDATTGPPARRPGVSRAAPARGSRSSEARATRGRVLAWKEATARRGSAAWPAPPLPDPVPSSAVVAGHSARRGRRASARTPRRTASRLAVKLSTRPARVRGRVN